MRAISPNFLFRTPYPSHSNAFNGGCILILGDLYTNAYMVVISSTRRGAAPPPRVKRGIGIMVEETTG